MIRTLKGSIGCGNWSKFSFAIPALREFPLMSALDSTGSNVHMLTLALLLLHMPKTRILRSSPSTLLLQPNPIVNFSITIPAGIQSIILSLKMSYPRAGSQIYVNMKPYINMVTKMTVCDDCQLNSQMDGTRAWSSGRSRGGASSRTGSQHATESPEKIKVDLMFRFCPSLCLEIADKYSFAIIGGYMFSRLCLKYFTSSIAFVRRSFSLYATSTAFSLSFSFFCLMS